MVAWLVGWNSMRSGCEPSAQSRLREVRSLSWSVQVPLALTVSGAFPDVGETESVQSGELAYASAGRHKHTRAMMIQLRRFTIATTPRKEVRASADEEPIPFGDSGAFN